MNDAESITRALGGKWYRRFGAAPCPVCQRERRKGQNALTLADGSDGRLLAHCKRAGCAYRDILVAAGIAPGTYQAPDAATLAQRDAERRAEAAKRARQAERIWQDARPIADTPAETYLRRRGIGCALPLSLRFHSACWHAATARRWPALVALVEGGEGFAVHRTWLRPDGAEKAPIAPAKAMLGATAGGAVQLSGGPGRLVVAEGIETALSVLSGFMDGPAMTWAALSTSGLRGLRLPAQPARLTVCPDGDAPGREAAHALAERAHAMGWQVGILDPGDGRDWNDNLTGRATAA